MKTSRTVADFLRCDQGLAVTEYAVMTSLILGGIIGMMSAFGDAVEGLYIVINNAFTS